MEKLFNSQLEESKGAIKLWWLILALGVIVFLAGILIFIYPTQSYIGMSMLFGLLILASGISQIVVSVANNHVITGRGWMIAGGIIEVILGLILSLNTAFSAAVLPFFLGFWLMFRSFSMMGLGGDMSAMKIPGSAWTIFTAILLLICSILILVSPLFFGIQAVIVWVGISMLFAGISMSAFSWQLKNLHKHM